MIYDAEQARFFLGPVTQEALSKLIPVPMSPGELASCCEGGVPVMVKPSTLSWNSRPADMYLRSRREIVYRSSGLNRITVSHPSGPTQWQKLYSLGLINTQVQAMPSFRSESDSSCRNKNSPLIWLSRSYTGSRVPTGAFTLTPPRALW